MFILSLYNCVWAFTSSPNNIKSIYSFNNILIIIYDNIKSNTQQMLFSTRIYGNIMITTRL